MSEKWTPGPWDALTDTIHSADPKYAGQQVADCSMRQRGEANAARIVQCVNSHEALVAALGQIIDECHWNLDCNHPGDDEDCADIDDCVGCTITQIARAALLAAKGEA